MQSFFPGLGGHLHLSRNPDSLDLFQLFDIHVLQSFFLVNPMYYTDHDIIILPDEEYRLGVSGFFDFRF